MDIPKLNMDEEYQKLAYQNDNNSNHHIRKINSERKLTCGILKRRQNKRKISHFIPKQQKETNNIGIKWDDKTIEEQKDYRKKHPLDKEKLKNSISRYASIDDNNDIYIQGLNKVNQINSNDEIINKIFNALNESSKKKYLKRNKSCLMLGRFKRKLNLKNFYKITEKEGIFDENLEDEQKLTLQNTLFNKINNNL
jgi:hypothetical protein